MDIRINSARQANRWLGFSLVELSIVLVILGLLVGGILSGQSLIRAAELRAVGNEYSRYVTATHTVRDKYFALPGDISNATRLWGNLGGVNCINNAGTGALSTGTCDGNGDGKLSGAAAISETGEMFQFWRQLAFAGIIEGSYTGLAGSNASWPGRDTIPGTNSPRSKMNNTGWGTLDLANYLGDPSVYVYDYGNLLSFGVTSPGNVTIGPALKAEEAWNIDSKMDDGKPGTGKVMSRDNTGFGTAGSCTLSASNTDYAGAYKLTNTALACSFFFPKPF
ncbi:MAG: type II secretion system protein [Rickettsiales bacterium]